MLGLHACCPFDLRHFRFCQMQICRSICTAGPLLGAHCVALSRRNFTETQSVTEAAHAPTGELTCTHGLESQMLG